MGRETRYVHRETPQLADAVAETVEYGFIHAEELGLLSEAGVQKVVIQGVGAIGSSAASAYWLEAGNSFCGTTQKRLSLPGREMRVST